MSQRGIFADEYGVHGRGALLIVGIVVLAAVGIMVAIGVIYGRVYARDCQRLQEQSGYATKVVSGECYMRVHERWIPADQYRMVEDAK